MQEGGGCVRRGIRMYARCMSDVRGDVRGDARGDVVLQHVDAHVRVTCAATCGCSHVAAHVACFHMWPHMCGDTTTAHVACFHMWLHMCGDTTSWHRPHVGALVVLVLCWSLLSNWLAFRLLEFPSSCLLESWSAFFVFCRPTAFWLISCVRFPKAQAQGSWWIPTPEGNMAILAR